MLWDHRQKPLGPTGRLRKDLMDWAALQLSVKAWRGETQEKEKENPSILSQRNALCRGTCYKTRLLTADLVSGEPLL